MSTQKSGKSAASRRLRYLLVIPDGTGIRNFFCTPFIDLLLETGSVHVGHGLPVASVAPFESQWGERVTWSRLPSIRDGVFERAARQSKASAQIFWQRRSRGEVPLKLRRPAARFRDRLMARVTNAAGWLFGGRRRIVWLDRLHRLSASQATHMPAFRDFIARMKPDVVFCSHQKSLSAVPAMLAACEADIPTATFIYSWDNLPKGRMPVHADHYLVWSNFMRDELLSYYPDVSADSVHVVGTPQFESYSDSSILESRAAFFAHWKLDSSRPVVCFSGDDPGCSPYDPRFLEDLADAMRSVPASERPQILFRRSPVDWSNRYDPALKKHPEITVCDPRWQSLSEGDWSEIVPMREDVALLVNLVYHADAVVNLGSTMAMDFAAYDKPAIYVAYNPVSGDPHWNAEDVYRRPHFQSVHELQPVYWVRSREKLAEVVMHAIRNPGEKRSERRAWLHRHVLQPMGEASERFADELKRLAIGMKPDMASEPAETLRGGQIRRRASTH